jgi:S1-C subfamily serine protease
MTDAGAAPTTSPPSAAPTSAAPTTATPEVRSVSVDAGADTSTAWSAAPSDLPTVIAKADVHAALSNFGALANSMKGAFTPTGARLDAVAPDSLLAKAGLRAGDIITSINNQPLRSLDDAANLYARAGSMKAATIQIQRAGKPMSLRLAIQ